MRHRILTIWAIIVCVMILREITLAEVIQGIEIDFVTIGDVGNAADDTGYGSINYNYFIGKYEITNAQWNQFTAVAGNPTGNNVSGVNPYDQSSVYTDAQQPTNNVSWYEIAQFCNYLTSGNKSQGVYRFSNGDFTGIDRDSAISTFGTIYVIPTEDEWYKAAYYTGNGYSLYAYGTDTSPAAGIDTNYEGPSNGQPWDVGTGTIEQNGTFDMMGNLIEWNETLIVPTTISRGVRGGAFWSGNNTLISSYRAGNGNAYYEFYDVGFRIAFIPRLSPPSANANGPYSVFVGDTLTLDANGSTAPDNDIVSYMWDMDYDDIFETDVGNQIVFDVNYSYLQSLGLLVNYEYEIRLKVTDSEGHSHIAETTCIILPKPAVEVVVDIKPGGCPNPVNTKSSGVLPVAILGSNDYDITTIDAISIRLAGVPPLRSGYEDVGSFNDCNCIQSDPDGLLDLTLKFKTQAIVEAIGDVNDGDIVPLELTGVLYDPVPFETPIAGTDCILIKGRHRKINVADINKDGAVNVIDFAEFANNWLR